MKTIIKQTICTLIVLVLCLSYLNVDAAIMPRWNSNKVYSKVTAQISPAVKCSTDKQRYQPSDKVVVKWQADRKAAYYTIELLNLTKKICVNMNKKIYAPKCTYEITDLIPGCNYSISVTAHNSDGTRRQKGNTVKFTVAPISIKSIEIKGPSTIIVGQKTTLTAVVKSNSPYKAPVKWRIAKSNGNNVTIDTSTGVIIVKPSAKMGDSIVVEACAEGYKATRVIKVQKAYILPNHTYFSQINYPQLKRTGCYITSSCMILSNLGFETNPNETYKANGNTTYLYRGRVFDYYNNKYSKQLGFKVVVKKNNSEKVEGKSDDDKILRIIQYLNEKDRDHGGVFVQFKNGTRTHAMVAIGYRINSKGQYEILYDDPGRVKNSCVPIEKTSFRTKDIIYLTVYSKAPVR